MHPLPRRLVEDLARDLDLGVAVETGTYLGDTALLLRAIFPQVWTIELSEELHARAQERHGSPDGLHFVLGSSADVLADLVAEIGQPALYWLDGHWSAGSTVGFTAGEERQCPVLEEIGAIDSQSWGERSCILIDDARLFLGPPPPPYRRTDFPTFLDVLDLLRGKFQRFVTVLDDVIIAGPPEIRSTVDAYWLEVLARKEDPHARLHQALNPPPATAARRLLKSMLPTRVTQAFSAWVSGPAQRRMRPRHRRSERRGAPTP